MSYRIKLLWKVPAELSSEGIIATCPERGFLFNRKGGRSFLRGLGGDCRATHAPVVLQPTDVFHQALHGLRQELGFIGSRFPVAIDLDLVGQKTRLNVSLHLYGTFVCATFGLDEFDVPDGTDFSKLQDLSAHPKLRAFVSRIFAITVCGDRHTKDLGKPFKTYPCIRIVAQSTDAQSWQQNMVGLVTRHPDASRIVDAVLDKNAFHQIDASLLLFDKQGIVGYVPTECSETSERTHLQRFGNAASMIEYAAMLQRQLTSRQLLPEDTKQAIIAPEDAFPNSVSARYMWALAVKEFSLQTELKAWAAAPVRPKAARILLVTVTSAESKAVHAAFAKSTGAPPLGAKVKSGVWNAVGIG